MTQPHNFPRSTQTSVNVPSHHSINLSIPHEIFPQPGPKDPDAPRLHPSRTVTTFSILPTHPELHQVITSTRYRSIPLPSNALSARSASLGLTTFAHISAPIPTSDLSFAQSAAKPSLDNTTVSAMKAYTRARRNSSVKATSHTMVHGAAGGDLLEQTLWVGISAPKPAACALSPYLMKKLPSDSVCSRSR